MACLPTYKGVRYTSIAELKSAAYFKSLNSPETIAEFKEFINNDLKSIPLEPRIITDEDLNNEIKNCK